MYCKSLWQVLRQIFSFEIKKKKKKIRLFDWFSMSLLEDDWQAKLGHGADLCKVQP